MPEVREVVDIAAALHQFVKFRLDHLDGDEKGEAQIFCDRLFRAFGHEGVKEAGATLEYRLKRDSDRGVSFADLVYKPYCLVEMKRSGTDLSKHFRQAFDYWVRAVPNRPRFVVLCNFDEFWVYDFDRQLDAPVDRLKLADLPLRWEVLSFLCPEPREPIFENDLVAVTKEAAAQVAAVFREMHGRGVSRQNAQTFTLQCVMAMFSEDIGLLPSHMFSAALMDSKSGSDAYDLVYGLFREMNQPGVTRAGRFKGTPYFNGGLFATVTADELSDTELGLLKSASATNWSAVRPEIFGTLFEQSMDSAQRHAEGAHFTSQADIARVVIPTIVEPWRREMDLAKSVQDLQELLSKLYLFRVLDPACGSGNFLYVAYREMRRIEHEIVARIAERRRGPLQNQHELSYVTPDHFLGIDINPFAVEVAKVTLLLGKKLAADELDDEQAVLPLDNLDSSIVVGDALFQVWPFADAIIGNPPYLGRRKMVEELGADYCARLGETFPGVRGVSDFVSYWFPLAHDALASNGRAGFVATKTIRQGDTRKMTLDYVVDNGGVIVEAVDLLSWSGDAQVTVSIVNWRKGGHSGPGILWTNNGLTRLEVPRISSSLSAEVDLKAAKKLPVNARPKRVFQGQTPGVTDGFELGTDSVELAGGWPIADQEVIHPFLGGNELLKNLTIDRWIIDVPERDADLAWRRYPRLMKLLEDQVLPTRLQAASRELMANTKAQERNAAAKVNWHHRNFLSSWWRLGYRREDMLEALRTRDRYIAITRTSSEKRGPVFTFVDSSVRLADSAVAFDMDDDYSFGILQSGTHRAWFVGRCTTLETRLTYTSGTVFDSFPWPQSPSEASQAAVAAAARDILDHRVAGFKGGFSLALQYNVLRQPGRSKLRSLHEALDSAVLDAYGFDSKVDLLTQILSLNLQCADREAAGEVLTAPGALSSKSRLTNWRLRP